MEGGPCNCWPDPWDGITGAEEIDDINEFADNMFCNSNVDESPAGGNVVGLHVFPTITEGLTTTWTGLTPGTEYVFVIWWMSVEWECSGVIFDCCADLWIIADGVEYIYDAVDDWTLVELCIEAQGNSITLDIQGIANSTNGYIILDDADCADANTECCTLAMDLPDDFSTCPNEATEILGSYSGNNGSINVEWTCDPADGINYLDDPFSENPIFEFTTTDENFAGIIYTFTFTGTDDVCDAGKEIEIEVLGYEDLSFPFEDSPLCSDIGEFDLPQTSNEGVNGNWDISTIFPTDHPGEILSFMFTPIDGEVDCPITSIHYVEVQEYIEPSFDFPLEYCRGVTDIISLPESSIEGIEGIWNYFEVELDQFPDGYLDLIFTPDESFCQGVVVVEIEIFSGDEVDFDLPLEYCNTDGILTFPTISLEGVDGFWTYDQIDLGNNLGINSNTFTAFDNGFDCYTEYEYVFDVIEEISPSFSFNTNLCSNENTFDLPTSSNEGYLGSWTVPSIDPANASNIVSEWTANPGQSDCLTQTSISFQVEPAIVPSFNLPVNYCINDGTFAFPPVSVEGIQGIWTTNSFDPLTIGVSLVNSTFIPLDNYCAESFEWSMNIIQAEVPEFNLPTSICESESPFTLPNNSINNLSGNWTVLEINPTGMAGNTITANFIPNQDCSSIYEYNIDVTSSTPSSFILPDYLCWDDQDLILPNISLENTIGSWSQDMIDVQQNVGNLVQVVFQPEEQGCFSSASYEIFVVAEPIKSFAVSDPTDCSVTDGSIIIQDPLPGEEYSIDNGVTWQASSNFENLNGGSYQVLVRTTPYLDCISQYQFIITSNDAPMLGGVLSMNIDNCTEDNGEISIQASGNNLEYSIDGGMTWQTSNEFLDLPAGNYQIAIREAGTLDCVVEAAAEVLDFPSTIIDQVIDMDVTDCDSQDGLIQIIASGQNLEYSIDGGINWSSDNNFDNLPFGEYEILVRSTDALDCIDTETVILSAPETVILNNLNSVEPNDCEPASGSILVEAIGSNLEYSIDNGQTWQDNPLFENLEAGVYMVIVRNSLLTNCLDETTESLQSLASNLDAPQVIIDHATACDLNDGSIEFLLIDSDIEYSIDGGASWYDTNLFTDLAAGAYDLIIRMKSAPDCTGEANAIIEKPDCPCPDLNIDFDVTQADCNNLQSASIEIVSVSGMDTPGYTINWNNGLQEEAISSLTEGWYVVEINYDQDCTWRDSVFIEAVEAFQAEVLIPTIDCEVDDLGFVMFTDITGGTAPYNILYNNEIYFDVNMIDSLGSGYHEFILEDAEGCQFFYEVEFSPSFELLSTLSDTILVETGEIISLDPGFDPSSVDDFMWTSHPQILNPGEFIAEVLPLESGEFTLTVYMDDCEYQLRVYLELSNPNIFIPNVFSPNGIDSNNEFGPQTGSDSDIEIIEFSIYDRWGNLMHSSKQSNLNNISWDGRFNGSIVNPGVYVYKLDYRYLQDQNQMIGTVTVLD